MLTVAIQSSDIADSNYGRVAEVKSLSENQVDSSKLYSSVLTELLYFQTAKYISFISVVFSFLIRNRNPNLYEIEHKTVARGMRNEYRAKYD